MGPLNVGKGVLPKSYFGLLDINSFEKPWFRPGESKSVPGGPEPCRVRYNPNYTHLIQLIILFRFI